MGVKKRRRRKRRRRRTSINNMKQCKLFPNENKKHTLKRNRSLP
jgi:hypothetical protein